MENALLVGLSRQMVLERQMDVVANNVANVNTTGFKADHFMFERFLLPPARENRFEVPDRPVNFVTDRGTWRDLRGGAIQQTGSPLDLAIDGPGYLVVQTPEGERYTRNGSLQLDARGQLVTSSGFPVLSQGGPIIFQNTDREISVAPDGRVTVLEPNVTNTESVRGTIRLVSFDQPQQLQKEGGNLFSAPAGVAPLPDTTSRVLQRSIEKSNVNGVIEISHLIEISRAYQQIGTLLQQQSDLHKNAIQQLANVPT